MPANTDISSVSTGQVNTNHVPLTIHKKPQADRKYRPNGGMRTRNPEDAINGGSGTFSGPPNGREGMYQDSAKRGTAMQFPDNLGKYFMMLNFHQYKRPNVFEWAKLQIDGTIALPLPQQLVDSYHVQYNIEAQGADGYIADKFTQGVHALPDLADSMNRGQSLSSVVGGVAGGIAGSAVGAAGAIGTGMVNNFTFGKAALQLLGVAENPFMTVLLNGPDFKRHHFVWKFSPRTKEESQAVRQICEEIKRRSRPAMGPLGMVYKYPSLITPQIIPNQEWMYTFRPCFIEQVTVNYNPSGRLAFYKGGAPQEVELEIMLLEIEIWAEGKDGSPGVFQTDY